MMTLLVAVDSQAQFSAFPSVPNDSQKVLGWNPNQPYACGRLLCSDVILQGTLGRSFTLAKNIAPGDPREEVEAAIEDRANLVENIVSSIQRTVLTQQFNNWLGGTPPEKRDRRVYRDRILRRVRERIPSKSSMLQTHSVPDPDLHPRTPAIEVGPENNQIVVFIPSQPDLGLAQQTIVTVTPLDLINAGIAIAEDTPVSTPAAESSQGELPPTDISSNAADSNTEALVPNHTETLALAQVWRNIIRHRLSDALWGNDYDWQYPFDRLGIASITAGMTVGFIWLVDLFKQLLRGLRRRLKNRSKHLQHVLMQDRESATTEGHFKRDDEDAGTGEPIQPDVSNDQDMLASPVTSSTIETKKRKVTALGLEELKGNPLGTVFDLEKTVIGQLQYLVQKVSLDEQSRNRQWRNFLQFLLRSLFWVEVIILFAGATLIALIFPGTRLYAVFFLSQAIVLPSIWMVISLADILVDFVSDRYLHQWAKSAELENPSSTRYALRVNTYSPAIQGATTSLFVALGVYLTIRAFGINPSVLASAGVAAVVVAFLSRNLLEDMLNGALILWTDRYAIGDVIQVGGITGLVEQMNLYVTQIRGAEGRLATIPNGQIRIVENLTKDWSRVDFKIEIAHNSDIEKALDIIQRVSEHMRDEDLWKERILEPASILGVDAVTHAGILIQVWIKTQPIQQFAVGREFRLRIKKAFDAAGIALGVPQQNVSYHNGNEALDIVAKHQDNTAS
ncbi:MAG: mechanosensitive ion channel family protein [Cyanobacteria bacterium P01_A01_bin.37]